MLDRSLTRSIVEAPTIAEILAARAAAERGVALRFLADGEGEVRDWTYQDLQAATARVAAAVRRHGLAGRRVVIVLEPGPEFVAGLFGAFQAGAVAVPCYPPVGARATDRLRAVVADCRPAAILVEEASRARVQRLVREIDPAVRAIGPDPAATSPGPTPGADARDLAVVQYTSGSTASPRGVALTHANLVSNCRTLLERMLWEPDRVGCTWLPPYHDMGLLGTVILSVYGGWPLVMLTPAHFVQRPFRWLKAMSDHGVTVTVAPNSALDMCVDTVSDDEIRQLDLGRLRQVFSGAEPIRASTVERFTRRFAACGLAPGAVSPSYGLAEATLLVTAKQAGTAARVERLDRDRLAAGTAVPAPVGAAVPAPVGAAVPAPVGAASAGATAEVVSCGAPAAGHRVVVVDPATRRPTPDDTVGEIWVAGPNVAAGYFDAETASAVVSEPFGGRLDATPADPAPYLRTGDLGFLRDGELFVTGRIKDVVVVSGRNLYPYDIEHAALVASDQLRRVAAFGVGGDPDPERLVVVGELRCRSAPDPGILAGIRGAVTAAVASATGVAPGEVHLGPVGTIPTTTSGKVRRLAARQGYLDRSLKAFTP